MKTLTLTFAALALAASQASAQVAVFSGSREAAEGRKVPIIKEGKLLNPSEIEAIDVLTELPAPDRRDVLKPLERVITVPAAEGKGPRRFKVCWAAGAAAGSVGSILGARIVPEMGGASSEMEDALRDAPAEAEAPSLAPEAEDHAEYGVEAGSARRLPSGDASVVLELELQRGGETVRIRVQITGGGEARLLPLEAR